MAEGLPPGSGTAALGKPIFAERCTSCHGEKGEDPKYSLRAASPADRGRWREPRPPDKPVLTVGSYWQYATTLWSYISRSQPFDEPGSLTPDQVYAVTAYLLHVNGIIGEQDVVDARSLPQIRMPNRDGFVPDARPDVGKGAKARTALAREGAVMSARRPVGRQGHGARPRGGDEPSSSARRHGRSS